MVNYPPKKAFQIGFKEVKDNERIIMSNGNNADVEGGSGAVDTSNEKEKQQRRHSSSLQQNAHSLPTIAYVTGKSETASSDGRLFSFLVTMAGYLALFSLSIVGLSLVLVFVLRGQAPEPNYYDRSIAYNHSENNSIDNNNEYEYFTDSNSTINSYNNNDSNNENDNDNGSFITENSINTINDNDQKINSNINKPTPSNEQSEEDKKKQREEDIINYLFNDQAIQRVNYRAMQWLAHEDKSQHATVPTEVSSISAKYDFVMRYALVAFYYDTVGENWSNKLNFLSNNHACDWFEIVTEKSSETESYDALQRGVACTEDNVIEALYFDDNNLKGSIPPEVGLLHSLRVINFEKNKLTGFIPDSVQKLKGLEDISVANNELNGTFPQFLQEMPGLYSIDLSYNFMTGTIPAGSNAMLTFLALDNNLFEGGIKHIFGSTMNNVGENSNSIQFMNPNIEFLYVENNNFNDIVDDQFLTGLNKLRHLDMSFNRFGGTIPEHFFTMKSLEVLDLSENNFHGLLPLLPTNLNNTVLKFLALQYNFLSGQIPDAIGKYKELYHLDLSYNSFNGTMPHGIVNLHNLEYLFLARNKFDKGEIPWFLQYLTNLVDLSLKETKLTGSIPNFFGEGLDNLVLLDLDDNELEGSIPTSIGNMKNIQFLLLNRNKLTGAIPSELANLDTLRMLFIDDNFLSGNFNGVYCNHVENIPYITADCGNNGTIECECCERCCADTMGCDRDMNDLVPYINATWQSGYKRVSYDFSDGNLTEFGIL